jgi:hypothetical protein
MAAYKHIREMLEKNIGLTDTVRVVLLNNKTLMLRVQEVGEDTVAGVSGKFHVALSLAAVAFVSNPSDANPAKD